MNNLYLIRHGIAAERGTYQNDDQRPLTKEGDRKTRKVARRLKDLNLQFDIIFSSPLVRAHQTADILLSFGLSSTIEDCSALAPDGNLNDWLTQQYKTWSQLDGKNLALVGHQPDLGNWAELLLWGNSKDALIVKKAGVIGITLPATGSPLGNSQLFWLTPPKFLLS